jgi:hypothetical protein
LRHYYPLSLIFLSVLTLYKQILSQFLSSRIAATASNTRVLIRNLYFDLGRVLIGFGVHGESFLQLLYAMLFKFYQSSSKGG